MKGNMNRRPFLTLRSIYVPKALDAVHCVHVHIKLERLAKGLDLLSPSPDPTLPAVCHLCIETLLVILCGRPVRGRGQ